MTQQLFYSLIVYRATQHFISSCKLVKVKLHFEKLV